MENQPAPPIHEPTFYILLALRGGDKHGYAILKDVEDLSAQRIKLSTGTLYGALNRMLDQRLIEQVEPKEGPRGKRTYRLTPAGLEAFEIEVERLQQVIRAVKSQAPAKG